jgi:DnaJ homolog subfamily C member 28
MKRWESLVDQKIREAMEQGEFDDLSGKGEPIDLTENPFEDPEWRLAHRMLRNAGFAPAWISERKDIDTVLEAARVALGRVWAVKQAARGRLSSAEARWLAALTDLRGKVTELNQRIDLWNLKAPTVSLQRKRINFDRELELIKQQ